MCTALGTRVFLHNACCILFKLKLFETRQSAALHVDSMKGSDIEMITMCDMNGLQSRLKASL